MSYEAKIQRLHDWLAVARLCLPDNQRDCIHQKKSIALRLYRATIEYISHVGDSGKSTGFVLDEVDGKDLIVRARFTIFKSIFNDVYGQ